MSTSHKRPQYFVITEGPGGRKAHAPQGVPLNQAKQIAEGLVSTCNRVLLKRKTTGSKSIVVKEWHLGKQVK